MSVSFPSNAASVLRISAVAVAAILLSGGLAQADCPDGSCQDQCDGGGSDDDRRSYGGYWYRYPGWQTYQWRSYMAYERARAERTLLWSQARRNVSEARRNHAEARRQEIENWLHELETRQMREIMGRQHRELREQMVRERQEASRLRAAERRSLSGPVDEAAEAERRAANKLVLARNLLNKGHRAAAQRFFQEIAEDFAGTTAAREIEQLLAQR